MRYIRFILIGLLIAGGIVLIIAHSISTEEVIDTVEGQKVAITTMEWNGKEVIFQNLNGMDYIKELNEPETVHLYYSGKLRLRQHVVYGGKKMRAKYNENFSQSNGYDIKLSEENSGSVFVLYVTPSWDVSRRNILFWKLLSLKKKHLSFSMQRIKD